MLFAQSLKMGCAAFWKTIKSYQGLPDTSSSPYQFYDLLTGFFPIPATFITWLGFARVEPHGTGAKALSRHETPFILSSGKWGNLSHHGADWKKEMPPEIMRQLASPFIELLKGNDMPKSNQCLHDSANWKGRRVIHRPPTISAMTASVALTVWYCHSPNSHTLRTAFKKEQSLPPFFLAVPSLLNCHSWPAVVLQLWSGEGLSKSYCQSSSGWR